MSNVDEEWTTEVNFENLFKIMTFAMRVNRSHPAIKRDIKWICEFGLLHGTSFLIFCLLVYSIIFHDLKNNDFTQACANGILCVVFSVVTFKYFILLWYQTIFEDMISIMNKDYELSKYLRQDEQSLVRNFARKGQGVINLWLGISICTAGLFPVKAIVLMIYHTIVGEFKFVHLYDLTYPDAVEEVKNTLKVYSVLYIMFLFYDLYAMIMYIAFAPLGPILMLHACGQIEVAQLRITRIFNENNTSQEINNKLKDIGRLLNDIYSFVGNAQTSLKILYELTLKATIIILPITLYQIIESFNNGEFRIEFVTIIFGAITLSGIPCYYSDVLMASGEKLRLAVYSCGWETYWDKKSRTFLLLLLLRTSQPIAIRTMFRDVCLDALTDVYHQSYAIFNVLNAVWK